MKLKISELIASISIISLLAVGCARVTSSLPSGQAKPPAIQTNYTTPLHMGTQTLFVEIADTDSARQQGLSGRERLNDNQGMLFDFGKNTAITPSFWMKDMKFNLDLVWIKNQTIIGITKNVPAPLPGTSDTELPLYNSPSPLDQVLEVNAGWTDGHGVKIGEKVEINN